MSETPYSHEAMDEMRRLLADALRERDEAMRRAAVMQGRFDEAMDQVERLTEERDRAISRERAWRAVVALEKAAMKCGEHRETNRSGK